MSTFMSRQTFARLVEARNQIVIGGGADGFPMEVFVPWAGNAITSAHGIYYIGAGLDAEEREPNVANRNYDVSLQETEGFIRSGMEGRNHSPFWQFLNALSNEVLGAPARVTSDRWGWSNLLKIGWSSGSPTSWPDRLKEMQHDACVQALREEFSRLQGCLIFIGSRHEFGILHAIVGRETTWHKEYEDNASIWWALDDSSGNLYVHGDHPGHARRKGWYDAELKQTIELTRTLLRPFET